MLHTDKGQTIINVYKYGKTKDRQHWLKSFTLMSLAALLSVICGVNIFYYTNKVYYISVGISLIIGIWKSVM